MSEENELPKETITTVRTKDPRRVEAGRRLGQMSRQLKEQKIRAKIEEEEKKSSPQVDYKILIGLAGLLLTGIAAYYTRLQYTHEVKEHSRHSNHDEHLQLKKQEEYFGETEWPKITVQHIPPSDDEDSPKLDRL